MNKLIQELVEKAPYTTVSTEGRLFTQQDLAKFAELIVAEFRNVLTDVYRETPLELCGPLLTADEKIAEHFYGVEE